MQSSNHAIILLEKFIHDDVYTYKRFWPEIYLKEKSYKIWAAKELIKLLKNNDTFSQKEIVYNFYLKMDGFSKSTDNREHNFIFETARDFAEDFMYELL